MATKETTHHIINEERRKTFKKLLIDNKLRLAITNTCNLSCFYCHNEGQEIGCKAQFISLQYVKEMCKWFRENKVYVESVNLTGGEPLLHPELIAIIDEVASITDEIRINTNATLLTKQLIDTFVEHGVFALKIGIDSLYAEQSKPSIYHNKTNLNHIVDMIKYANKHMRVVLNTVVTKFNYDKIDYMVEFAKKVSIPRIKIIRLHDVDSRGLNSQDVPDEFKTNQKEGECYYYFFSKYVARATKIDNHPLKGRTDVFFEDGFEIRFCEDICTFGACGNMFTEIDSFGNIIICPKYHVSKHIDFSKSFEEVKEIIEFAKSKTCNAKRNYFEMKEREGQLNGKS